MKKKISLYFFLAIFFIISVLIVTKKYYVPTQLKIYIQGPAPNTYQLFYDIGRRFNEYDSEKVKVYDQNGFKTIVFDLPAKKIRGLRFDPGNQKGLVVIKKICIGNSNENDCWSPEEISQYFVPANQVNKLILKGDSLVIRSAGNDPYLYIKRDVSYINKENKPRNIIIKKLRLFLIFIPLMAILYFLSLFFEDFKKYLSIKRNGSAADFIFQYRYLIALFIFIILVAGKFHGSSITVWDRHIHEKTKNYRRTLLLGVSRPIRSDEWLVLTPMQLAQVQSEKFFPVINKNIRSEGQNMLIFLNAPVFDFTLLSRPFNWGYVLFGKEFGLSWFWFSRLILLLLVSFEICMIITHQNRFLSLLGALWITFAPGVQWWFSTGLVELLIYSQAIVVCVYHYTIGVNKKLKTLLILIMSIGITGFILTIYPPFQVPLGYLLLVFIVPIIYINRKSIRFEKYDYLLFSLGFVIIVFSLYSFISKSMDALSIVRNTVYPGHRNFNGGNYNINFLQLYLINWLLPYKNIHFSNSSELSTFINFLPAVFFVFFKAYGLEKNKVFLLLILLYLLLQITWLLVPFPQILSRMMLFSYVPESRLQLITSLTSVYLSLWIFSLLSKHNPFKWFESLLLAGFITVIYYHSIIRTPMLNYLESRILIIVTLLFFFVINFSYIAGMRRSFAILLSIYLIVAGLTVTPFSRGLDPIYVTCGSGS